MKPEVQSDLALLVPAFRERVVSMLDLLKHMGYNPRVWETVRTPERAQWLADKGGSRTTGVRSMHLFGIAVDVICDDHMWRCPQSCDFFDALGRAANAEGLKWGGDFGDLPHVQAIEVSQQNALRSAPYPACYATAALRGLV